MTHFQSWQQRLCILLAASIRPSYIACAYLIQLLLIAYQKRKKKVAMVSDWENTAVVDGYSVSSHFFTFVLMTTGASVKVYNFKLISQKLLARVNWEATKSILYNVPFCNMSTAVWAQEDWPLTSACWVHSNVSGLGNIHCIRYLAAVDPFLSTSSPVQRYYHMTSGSVEIPLNLIIYTGNSSSIGEEPVP